MFDKAYKKLGFRFLSNHVTLSKFSRKNLGQFSRNTSSCTIKNGKSLSTFAIIFLPLIGDYPINPAKCLVNLTNCAV